MPDRIFAILTMTAALAAAPLAAGEMSLEFDFVTITTESLKHQIGSAEEGALEANRAVGVATFSDGMKAIKKFVYTSGPGAPIAGISNYTFENGDSITAAFTVDAQFQGTYTVVGGTGAYEGATGTGSFAPRQTTWEDAIAWTGSFSLTTP